MPRRTANEQVIGTPPVVRYVRVRVESVERGRAVQVQTFAVYDHDFEEVQSTVRDSLVDTFLPNEDETVVASVPVRKKKVRRAR